MIQPTIITVSILGYITLFIIVAIFILAVIIAIIILFYGLSAILNLFFDWLTGKGCHESCHQERT